MRKIVLSVLVIFCSVGAANAQVKGILLDSASKKPIENAVIALMIKASSDLMWFQLPHFLLLYVTWVIGPKQGMYL